MVPKGILINLNSREDITVIFISKLTNRTQLNEHEIIGLAKRT